MSIGDTLAEARRQAGLTITQVSQQTRIRETIIRGIERGDFSACGGDFYARGHIRSIARIVGVDPDQLIREYDAAHGAPHAIRAAEVFEPSTPIRLKERRSLNWSAAMILALVIIAGYVIYHAVSGTHNAAPSAAQTPVSHPHHSAAPPPSSSPPASPDIDTTAKELVIKVVVTSEPCWVGFTSLTGGYLTQATLPAGSVKTWTFKHAVDMTLGNPAAVALTVNGTHRLSPGAQTNAVTLPFRPVQQAIS
ncbi:MAG TPA: RodZ domain-containing protein [Streptosporangiaceae bacterium]